MNPLRITTILGGRQRVEKMVQTGAQDRRKGIIERYGWIEAKLLRLPGRRWCVGRKVKAARRLAADGRPDRPMLREPLRELVDCAKRCRP